MQSLRKADRQAARLFLCLIVATFVMGLFFVATQWAHGNRRLSNTAIYILACGTYGVSFFAGYRFLPNIKISGYAKWLLPASGLLLLGWLLAADYLPLNTWGMNPNELPWHRESWLPYALLALTGVLSVFGGALLDRWSTLGSERRSQILFMLYALLIAALCAILCYRPLLTSTVDYFHFDAYTSGVYNVYYGEPINSVTSGIYGRHGLFLAPLLRLMGGPSVENITLLMAGLAFVTSLLFTYSVRRVTNKPVLWILVPLAVLLIFTVSTKTYYQSRPHRIILFALFSFMITWPRKNKGWWAALAVTNLFALLWNTDTGLVYTVACMLYMVSRSLHARARVFLLALLKSLGWLVGLLCSAMLIVNLYNTSVGGSWILSDFFYPVNSANYDIAVPLFSKGAFSKQYVSVLYAYFWVSAFLLGVAFITFVKQIADGNQTAKHAEILTTAAFGLGSMVYYINRPAYNNLLVEVMPVALCLAAIAAVQTPKPSKLQVGIRWFAITMITAAAVFGVCGTVIRLNNPERGTRAYVQAADEMRGIVPPNTFAMGVGANETYAELAWDPISRYDAAHYRLYPQVVAQIIKDLEQQPGLVLFSDQHAACPALLAYLQENFQLTYQGDSRWVYYTRVAGKETKQ